MIGPDKRRGSTDRWALGIPLVGILLAGVVALSVFWIVRKRAIVAGSPPRAIGEDVGGSAPTQPANDNAHPAPAPPTRLAPQTAPVPATGPVPRATTRATQPRSAPASKPWSPPRFKARRADRKKMVETIRGYRLKDQAVLRAMAEVPRHEFVPAHRSKYAYSDSPLPIGYGQTISQPYIVAEMTRVLGLNSKSRVLEIGTGSGYQAAVLSEFTRHVYTIEIVKPLADAARKRLRRLGYTAVKVGHADGYYGWKRHAPFDAIIVTAAAGQIPPPLIRQLAPGGRMVIPVGPVFATQSLMLVTKDKDGTVRSRSIMAVRFVPFRRKDVSAK